MRKQKRSMLVLVVITAFMATVLFLLGLSDANGAGGNRFVDLGDGTVRDTSTGLIWLKDANCLSTKNWDDAMDKAAALHTGECGLTDGSSKGDWRLPTKEEWEAFVDTNYSNPALSNAAGTGKWSEGDAFNNLQSLYYWSSTTHEAYSFYAWYVYMYNGSVGHTNKTFSYYVWPVGAGN
jgi:hypothetical protein